MVAGITVDDRDRDMADKVKMMGHSMRPEDVAELRAVWPDIVKEMGKLEDRTGVSLPTPRSIEDVILAVSDKKCEPYYHIIKNVDLNVIPLTDELREILTDLMAKLAPQDDK